FAEQPEFITSKSVDDISVKSDTSVATDLKVADTKLPTASDGSASLEVRNASDSMLSNRNSAADEPVNVNDTAAATLSNVKNQNPLDAVADPEAAMATRNLIVGQNVGFDRKTVTQYAESSVGKVKDNKVPIE